MPRVLAAPRGEAYDGCSSIVLSIHTSTVPGASLEIKRELQVLKPFEVVQLLELGSRE